ncbi:MAG: phosphoenolpyruvate carboxylase [Chloroflexi bacterium]|nr:MAG: phosphoenolpyruvate carboxylase [Chloroflexota bacterium]
MTNRQQATTDRKTNPLSADIRLLGNLLGQIIREQEGDAAFDLVEQVRHTAIARRQGDIDKTDELRRIIDETGLDARNVLIKAFGNYFQLINIAEDQQRIRVLRQREAEGELSESIHAAVHQLRDAGETADDVRALLERIRVRLVFTAHPSEAKRTEVLVKLQHISAMMNERDSKNLLPREHRMLEAALLEEIEELWQTRPTRSTRKTVDDEVDFGIYFIKSVVMDVLVNIYDDLRDALSLYYPAEDWSELPPLLRFASWIGGDRDGNPNVTPGATRRTVAKLREAAQSAYLPEIDTLRDHLTQWTDDVGVSDELRKTVEASLGTQITYPGELYRHRMERIHEKLESGVYRDGDSLLADLRMVQRSLQAHRGIHVANGLLRRLIDKVALFGLHLVPLDIREDARLHSAAVAELFKHYGIAEDYASLPEDEKQRLLIHEINNPRPLFPPQPNLSHTTNLVIETWRMMADLHHEYGPLVIDSAIASMSQEASDVLTMLLFATEVGIADDLDIVPLFETIDDLRHASAVMQALFVNPVYHAHLAVRGMRQQIMIGYSDSSKDGGYLASNWGLYTAQEQLAETCNAAGVALELFHGRGGSIGRGGGPTNRSILSQPPESLRGGIKITEQGEVIAYRYLNMGIAQRHLHQVLNAALLAMGSEVHVEVLPKWRAVMNTLSEAGRTAYRKFVYETDGFLEYWQQATPINELSHMTISSRPAKRKSGGGFESIRAIPWVFSWMQSRAIIPSWFGVGYALEALCKQDADGLATLRTMYRDWPFFTALIDNTQLDLAKADLGIAEQYASLVEDAALRDRIFNKMRDEHERASVYICRVLEQEHLLDRSPVLQRSIERRNPYVDPLNFIQVALLREWRRQSDSAASEALLTAILASINGIAAGMKTTG